MSAPNPGRQSPDPERQTGAQQQDPPGSGKVGEGSSDDQNKKESEDTKFGGLESNPKSVMDDKAAAVTGKDGSGGD